METASVRCACGATFAANAQMAGKQVNCPTCGQLADVPPQSVPVICPCGNHFHANSVTVGQHVNCPNCGQSVRVAQPQGPGQQFTTQAEFDSDTQVIAVLAYLSYIGLIVAFILHTKSERKNSLGTFHLRQAAGIYAASILLGVVIWPASFIAPLLGEPIGLSLWFSAFGLVSLVLGVAWCYGLYCAIVKTEDPVPVIGEFFQDVFKFIE